MQYVCIEDTRKEISISVISVDGDDFSNSQWSEKRSISTQLWLQWNENRSEISILQ